eukprot:Colp12_sorted_trinity150504_noHs@32088
MDGSRNKVPIFPGAYPMYPQQMPFFDPSQLHPDLMLGPGMAGIPYDLSAMPLEFFAPMVTPFGLQPNPALFMPQVPVPTFAPADPTFVNPPKSAPIQIPGAKPSFKVEAAQRNDHGLSTTPVDDMLGVSPPTEASMEEDPELKEVRRAAHIQAEQKRRNKIRVGFEELKQLIPGCKQFVNRRFSKAALLQSAVDFITNLAKQRESLQQELQKLQHELASLRAIIEQYQQLENASMNNDEKDVIFTKMMEQRQADGNADQIQSRAIDTLETAKFYIFCTIVESLFESFNRMVSLDSPEALTKSLLTWVEEYCRPEKLKGALLGTLTHLVQRSIGEENTATIQKWIVFITNSCKDTISFTQDTITYTKDTIQAASSSGKDKINSFASNMLCGVTSIISPSSSTSVKDLTVKPT